LDGRDEDWAGAMASYALAVAGAPGDGAVAADDSDPAPATLRLGTVDDTLFLFLRVGDTSRQRGDAHWPIIDRLDHVRLGLHGRQGVVELRLANAASGPLIATGSDGGPLPVQLRGAWLDDAD